MKETSRSAVSEQNQAQDGPPKFLIDAANATNVGDYDRAIELLKQGIDQDSFAAYKGLGDIYLFRGESAEAVEWLTKARDCKPESISVIESIEQAVAAIDREKEAAARIANRYQEGMRLSKYNSYLAKFKNIHKDREAILFALGPSIKKYRNIDKHDNMVKFGLNAIWSYPHLEETLDYYHSGSAYYTSRPDRENMDRLFSSKHLVSFASAYEDGLSHIDINRGNIGPERARELGANPFENTANGSCLPYDPNGGTSFTHDVAKYCTYGDSIVFPAIQHALYMGVRTLHLVGCDGGFTVGPDSGDLGLLNAWLKFRHFKDMYYPNVRIISINPVSLKGWFEDVHI